MTVLAHGWTASHATALARRAARDHFSRTLPVTERADIAFGAIVTAILEAPGPPLTLHLLHAGRDAITAETTAVLHLRGVSNRDKSAVTGGYARYWLASDRTSSPWEDALVELVALGQVWAVLPARHCRDLQALADCGTYQAAARSLGTTDATFRVRISQARAAFRAWWHEHETPPGMWGADRRTAASRPRAVTHAIRSRTRDRSASAQRKAAAA